MDEALQPGAVHIAGQANELSRFSVKSGDVDTALAGSAHLLEAVFTTAFMEHAALERESLLGKIDEAGRITVVGGTHQPHNQQRFIAEMLGLPARAVRMIVPTMGGTFGGKQDPWPFLAVALATYYVRRPVCLAIRGGSLSTYLQSGIHTVCSTRLALPVPAN